MLRFLGGLSEKDETQKAEFLYKFNNYLEGPTEFTEGVLCRRVLPELIDKMLDHTSLNVWPMATKLIFRILDSVTSEIHSGLFMEIVWPKLSLLLIAKEIQIETVTNIVRK